MSDLPPVSIVIPSYNRAEVLCDTVVTALAQNYPDFEVIVVDQTPQPSNAVRTFIENAGPRLRYIKCDTPNTPGARNAGLRIARGEIIVFVDDDVVLEPDYLAAHVRRYADPSVGGVMGITFAPDETDEAAVLTRDLDTFEARGALADGCFRVATVAGCNCSFRKRAILEAGMCDERFTGSGWCEETDLAIRVDHLGYLLLLDPQVRLVHLAVRAGGAANRDPRNTGLRDEHCRHRLYLYVKNRAILGNGKMLSSLWGQYRGYALNRRTLASPAMLVRLHWRFVRGLFQAAWAAMEGPIVSHPEIPAQ